MYLCERKNTRKSEETDVAKIVAIVNQKGGVGKTTTCVNLAAALHQQGKRILLCDFDPQANATSGMGVDKRKIKYSVYDVTINGVPAEKAIFPLRHITILPRFCTETSK